MMMYGDKQQSEVKDIHVSMLLGGLARRVSGMSESLRDGQGCTNGHSRSRRTCIMVGYRKSIYLPASTYDQTHLFLLRSTSDTRRMRITTHLLGATAAHHGACANLQRYQPWLTSSASNRCARMFDDHSEELKRGPMY